MKTLTQDLERFLYASLATDKWTDEEIAEIVRRLKIYDELVLMIKPTAILMRGECGRKDV